MVISHVLPPSSSGQAVILYYLLKGIAPERYCLVSSQNYTRGASLTSSCTTKLGAQYYFFSKIPQKILDCFSYLHSKSFFIPLDMYVFFRSVILGHLLKKNSVEVIIACTADLLDPYIAFKTSRRMKIPFVFYAFDDYEEQWVQKEKKEIAHRFGPIMIKGAEKVIVPNECLLPQV